MSRGIGWQQTALLQIIRTNRRPLTFAEIRGSSQRAPARVRSVRRSLQHLVRDETLIALGSGGRADPHRYFLHPFLIGCIQAKNKEEGDILSSALMDAMGVGR